MNVSEVEEDGGNRKGKNCSDSLGSFLSLAAFFAKSLQYSGALD